MTSEFRDAIECKVAAEYETVGEDWIIPFHGEIKTYTGSQAWHCRADGEIAAARRVFNRLFEHHLHIHAAVSDELEAAIDRFEADPCVDTLAAFAWELRRSLNGESV